MNFTHDCWKDINLCLPVLTCGYLWLQMERSAVGEGRTSTVGSPVWGLSWPTTTVRTSGTCWGPSVGAPVPSCSVWSVTWTTSRSSSSLIVSHQLKSINSLTVSHEHKSYKHKYKSSNSLIINHHLRSFNSMTINHQLKSSNSFTVSHQLKSSDLLTVRHELKSYKH